MSDREPAGEPKADASDGVDVTLIHRLLSITPAERLEVLQSNARSLETLRGAADRR